MFFLTGFYAISQPLSIEVQNPDTLNNGQTFRTCSSSAFRIIDNSSFAINGQHEVFVRADSTQGWGTSTAYNLRSGWQNISSLLSLGWNQVRVRVTESGTGNIIFAYIWIRVDPPPVITFSPIPDACINAGSVDLNTYVSPPGGTFSGPAWINANGIVNLDGNLPVTTSSITYTYTDANGCTNSAQQNWTLLTIPNIFFFGEPQDPQASVTNYNDIPTYRVCYNADSILVKFYFPNNSGYDTYSLDLGDGTIVNGTAPIMDSIEHMYTGMGLYEVTLTLTNSTTGCSNSLQRNVFFGSSPALGGAIPGNSTDICLTSNGWLLELILTNFQNNPAGTIYTVTFGDGSPEQNYLHPPPDTITHLYTESSCGVSISTQPNSYYVFVQAENPCSPSDLYIGPITLSEPPIASFEPDDSICIGQPTTISSTADPGTSILSSNNFVCDSGAKYIWEISPSTFNLVNGNLGQRNGILIGNWSSGTKEIDVSFNDTGQYIITHYVAPTGGTCPFDVAVDTVCVEQVPDPSFVLNSGNKSWCIPDSIIAIGTSTDGVCEPYSSSYILTHLATQTQTDSVFGRDFRILADASYNEGPYHMRRVVTSYCGESIADDTIVFKKAPLVNLGSDTSICGLDTLLFSQLVWTPFYERSYGDTLSYQWTITPNSGFNYIQGTSATDSVPVIEFTQFGQYTISLEFSNECSQATDNFSVIFYDKPIPVGATDTLLCFGEGFQFNVNGSIGAPPYQFEWFNQQGLRLDSSNTFGRPLNRFDSIYTLRITDALGCYTDSTFTVDVNDSLGLSFDTASMVTCAQAPFQLSAQVSGGSAPYTYEWGPASLLNDPTLPNPTFLQPQVGQWFTLTVRDIHDCPQSDSVFVIVNPLPTIALNANQLLCLNDTLQLGSTDTNIYQYNWTSDPPGLATTVPQPLVTPTDTTTYTLILTDISTQCTDTFSTTVSPIPLPQASYQASTLSGCSPLSISLTNNSSVTSSLQWLLNDSIISNQSNPQITLVNPLSDRDSVFEIRLSVQAGNGCQDDTVQFITVAPQPSISIALVDSGLCSQGSTSIINNSTFKAPAIFSWDSGTPLITFSDSSILSPQVIVGDYRGAQDTVVWLVHEILSADSCAFQDSIAFTIYARPTPSFNLPASACTPFTLQPADASQTAGDSTFYSWTISPSVGLIISGEQTANPSFDLPVVTSPTQTYTISLTVSDERGCDSTIQQTYTTFPKAVASFTLPADSCAPLVFSPLNTSFNGIAVGDTSGMTFQWTSSNGQTSADYQPVFTLPASLIQDTVYTFQLIVQNSLGCADTLLDSITVFPDPVASWNLGATVGCAPFIIDTADISVNILPNLNDTLIWQIVHPITDSIIQQSIGAASLNYTLLNDNDSVRVRLIAISSHGCRSDTIDQIFKTIENPVPGFIAIPDSACSPVNVQITDTSTTGVNHNWYVDGVLVSNQQNPTLALDNISNTLDELKTIKLVVTAGSTGCADSTEQQIVVWPAPLASFNLDSSACPNQTISIANTSIAKAPDSSYWSLSTGFVSLSDSTATNPDLLIPDLQSGSDSIITVNLRHFSADACARDTSHDIIIYSRPTASFVIPQSECGPVSVFPSDSSESVGGGLQYQWSITPIAGVVQTGLNTISPQFDIPVSLNDSIVYRISQIVTDSRGCSDSSSQQITVYGKPSAAMSASPSDSCGPLTIQWTNNSASAYPGQLQAGLQFRWDLGNGDTSNLAEPIAQYLQASEVDTQYIAQLIVTDALGCSDTISDTITVYPDPIAQLSTTSTLDCAPFVLDYPSISATAYTTANDSLVWQIWTSSEDSLLASYSGASALNYTILEDDTSIMLLLIAYNEHGCRPDTARQLFTTIENPQPGFVLSADSACHPFNLQITDTSTIGVSHQWFVDEVLFSSQINPQINLINPSAVRDTSYTIKLVITAGFSGCKDSTEQIVTVWPAPEPIIQPILATCPNDTVQLMSNSLVKGNGNYQWTTTSNFLSFINADSSDAQLIIPDLHTGADSVFTINLQLISPDSCVADTTIDVTVYSRPSASISLPLAACAPMTLNPIDSSTSADGGSLQYQWQINPSVPATGLTSSTPSFDIPVTQSNSIDYEIFLQVIDSRGCIDTLRQIYTVYPKPTADFQLSDPDSCGPHQVTFINLSQSGQAGQDTSTMSFHWSFGDGDTSVLGAPSHIYQAAIARDTLYTAQLISSNAFGCQDTTTSVITVYPDPIADFQSALYAECALFTLDTSTISVVDYPLANDNYLWEVYNINTGAVLQTYSGISGIDYTIIQDGDTVGVRLIVSNVHNCKPDTLERLYITLPDPVAAFTLPADQGCSPFQVQIHDSSSAGVSYQWFINGSQSSTLSSPIFTLTNTSLTTDSLYIIELVVTAGTGCTDTLRDSVVVYAAPDAQFQATEVCETFTTSFTDLSTTIDSLISWTWNFGDGDTSIQISPIHTYDSAGVYIVSLTVGDRRGCQTTFSDSVFVRPNPIADFDILHACYPDSICVGVATDLNDSSFVAALGQPIDQWNWDINVDGTIDYTTQFPQHTFNSPGVFDVALYIETQYGCRDTILKSFNVVDIPVASFSMDSSRGCGPLQVNFTDLSTGKIDNWYWRFFAEDGSGNDVLIHSDSTNNPNPVPPFVQSFIQDTTYFIELTVSNCCGSNSYLDSVKVLASPVADFLAAPDSGCSPLPVTLMLDGFVKGSPNYLTLDFGDGTPLDTLNEQWLIQPNGDTLWYWGQQFHTFIYNGRQMDTTFFVTLTASNECGDSSIAYPIVVRPNTVQAFFQAQPMSGCEDLTVNFTDFSFGGQNITWCFEYDLASGNCGPVTSGGTTATHTYTRGGTYTVAQIVDDGCSIDTAFQQIDVFPAPVPAFQIVHNGCQSDTVRFINNSTIDSGSINFVRWYLGDGDSSSFNEPTHYYSSGGTYTVCLKLRSNFGCWEEFCDTLMISDNPQASFTVQGACLNEQPIVFTNTSSPGTIFNSTFWDFGDGNTSTQFSPNHTFAQAGTYRVWLFHENDAGCWDSVFSDITIDSIPTADFSALLVSGDTCSLPQSYQYTNNSLGAQGYLWDFDFINNPGTWTSTLVDPVFSYTTPGFYTTALIAFNSLGCTDTLLVPIEVKPVPEVYLSASQESGCAPLTVQFRDSLYYNWPVPITITSYFWDFGDGNTSSLQFPLHTYLENGQFDVTLTVTTADGCSDSLTVQNLIEIFETPAPSFIPFETTSAAFIFDNTSTSVSNGAVFNWSFGDGSLSNEESPFHDYQVEVYDQDYAFEVCLTIINANGCDSTFCDTLEIIGLRLYVPNAFTPEQSIDDVGEAVYFLPKGHSLRSYELEIFDQWGNRVFRTIDLDSEGIPIVPWNGRKNNSGELLPMGAYVWTIKAMFDGGVNWRGMQYESGRIETYGTVMLIR